MIQRYRNVFFSMGTTFLIMVLFQNCSEVTFKTKKQETLQERTVFDENKLPPAPPETIAVPVKNTCSNWGYAHLKTGVADSAGLKAVMVDLDDPSNSCETTNSDLLKDDILAGKNIVFPDCKMSGNERVMISLVNNSGQNLLVDVSGNVNTKVGDTLKNPGVKNKTLSVVDESATEKTMSGSFVPLTVFTGGRGANEPKYVPLSTSERLYYSGGSFNSSSSDQNAVQKEATSSAVSSNPCDIYRSPLVIDLRGENHSSSFLDLSAPHSGVLFDIAGISAETPHQKMKIGWFESSQAASSFALLALPNEKGRVEGINELFGDNTLGSDGKLSSDGFAALAKHDGEYFPSAKNGKIDSNDFIYQHLALWRDKNLDGVSQPNELTSLKDAGIESIDLQYDPGFYERDQHGNEARYKSVVQTEKGELRPIFDLWFRQ